MPSNSSVETYIVQWLKTATGGTVTAVFAWGVDRMELHCHHCGMTYTSDIPKDVTTNDYGVQSFVQQHLHRNSQVWYNGKSWVPLAQEKDEMSAKKIAEMQQTMQFFHQTHQSAAQQMLENKIKLEEMNKTPNKPFINMTPVWGDPITSPFITNESPAKKDWVMVDGKKMYWVRDKDGKVVGVSDKPNTPPPVKKVPKESEGRKFR